MWNILFYCCEEKIAKFVTIVLSGVQIWSFRQGNEYIQIQNIFESKNWKGYTFDSDKNINGRKWSDAIEYNAQKCQTIVFNVWVLKIPATHINQLWNL